MDVLRRPLSQYRPYQLSAVHEVQQTLIRSGVVRRRRIGEWMNRPHPMLGGATPVELALNCEVGRVLALIDRMCPCGGFHEEWR